MTFDELLSKTKLTEDELKNHLVLLSTKYLDWLGVASVEKALISDCTKYYKGFQERTVPQQPDLSLEADKTRTVRGA